MNNDFLNVDDSLIGELTSDLNLVGEVVISDNPLYVKFSDIASAEAAGIIKAGNCLEFSNTGVPSASTLDYNSYSTKSNDVLISKGTLENVVNKKITDAINGIEDILKNI